MNGIRFLGVIAAVFAIALLGLPTLRVAQGRLAARHAAGLWISGGGFLLLALAAFALEGAAAQTAVLVGVIAAVAGNVIQRRSGNSDRNG